MKNRCLLLTMIVLGMFLFLNLAYALTADSSSYSVSMFGTGVQATNLSSDNFEARALLITGAGTRNANNSLYTTNIGFWENTTYHVTVSITSYSISPSPAVIGSTVSLYISALNAQNVWAVITRPDDAVRTLTLSNNDYTTYTPSIVGRYNITFYANSSSGAIASAISSFVITEETPVTPPPSGGGPSGGGGGTTTIIEKCVYNWDCTPWSICLEGKQKRICKNIGTCNGTESKPIEEMLCSESLFDISLKLKDIELTENRNLKFKVNLTEKIGRDKIDVYIKTSIINKEDYEIFSQIETKAILKSLSYEKEIDDISLADGEYTLRVDVLYGNLQRAFAEQKITIEKGKITTIKEIPSKPRLFDFILNNLTLLIIIFLIIIIIILILVVLEYRKKIKESLRKIKVKHSIVLIFSFVVILSLFIIRNKLIGFVVSNVEAVNINWKFVWIVLIMILIGLLIFIYRKKIKKIIENIKEKTKKNYPKNSIKGLIKKKVYTEEGDYIGKVEEAILGDCKIDSLKIKFDKKVKKKNKGIIVKYKNMKSVGHIVIIENKILEMSL